MSEKFMIRDEPRRFMHDREVIVEREPRFVHGAGCRCERCATTCAFPSPPVRMVYCQPAAFQQINGQKYQKLVYAYGQARPML